MEGNQLESLTEEKDKKARRKFAEMDRNFKVDFYQMLVPHLGMRQNLRLIDLASPPPEAEAQNRPEALLTLEPMRHALPMINSPTSTNLIPKNSSPEVQFNLLAWGLGFDNSFLDYYILHSFNFDKRLLRVTQVREIGMSSKFLIEFEVNNLRFMKTRLLKMLSIRGINNK